MRRPSICILLIALLGATSIGCGSDDECDGSAVSGEPVTCGKSGTFDRTMCVDGKLRRFREYVPATVTCEKAPPLIVFLHGNSGSETDGDAAYGVADELGAVFIALRGHPQEEGYLGFGPDGIPNTRTFLTRIVDETRREFPTDPFTVLTGFSAGGFYSAYCIAWLNDRLSGVGIFASGISEYWMTDLNAAPNKLPVFARVGTKDAMQTYTDSLVNQLKAAGWPPERIDSQRFEGGHKWDPAMIRGAYDFAKSLSP